MCQDIMYGQNTKNNCFKTNISYMIYIIFLVNIPTFTNNKYGVFYLVSVSK